MNMISTGAFLTETDASTKQHNLVKKLTAAWEKKNAKAARAGGVSLMALSLAACGSDNDTATTAAETPVVETPTTPVVPTVNAITLTGSETTVAGTSGADKISGVVSALTSADTVNEAAVITGGDGDDTLALSMTTNFGGFTAGTGSMSGVETVELTNSSSASRQFDASGVSGVTTYVVDGTNGAVTLIDVADLAALSVKSLASGAVSVTFATATVKGTADSWSVDVNGVGTANSAAATAAANTKYVDVTATGVETLTLASNGAPAGASAAAATTNYVSLAGTSGSTTVTITGTSAIDIQDVATAITSFDASAATGAVSVDLTNAAADALTSVKTGSGNDSVTLTPQDMPVNATIALGDGTDTLTLSGATDTVSQYAMTGVETLDVTLATGTASIALTSADNPSTYVVAEGENNSNAFTGVLTFIDDSGAKEIDIVGAHANTSALINSDTTGAVTVDFDPTSAASATSTETAATDVVVDKAASLTVDIAAHEVVTGTLSADAATSVNVTTASTGQTLDLQAAKVQSLDITTGGTLAIAATADIGSAQTLTVSAGKGVDLTGSSETLNKLSSATLSGSGTTSAVTLGAIGATDLSYATTITASGLKGGLTIGNIDAGTESVTLDLKATTGAATISNAGAIQASKAVTIEADGATGAIDLGTIGATGATVATVVVNARDAIGGLTVGNGTTANVDIFATSSITVNGSNLNANGLQIDTEDTATSTTVALSGGISTDDYDIATGTKTSALTVTGDLGLGADTLDITIDNTSSATGQTIDVSGFVGETVTFGHSTADQTGDVVKIVGSKATTVTETINLNAGTFTKLEFSDIGKVTVDTNPSVNGSAFTGKTVTVQGVAATDVLDLTGTDAADTFDFSGLTSGATTAVMEIHGGKGADTITGSGMTDHYFILAADNGSDTIKDFVAGTDALNLGAIVGTNASATNKMDNTDGHATQGTITGNDIDGQVGMYRGDADTATEVAALFGTAANHANKHFYISTHATDEQCVVLTGADGSTTVYAWHVNNTATEGVVAAEVSLLATLTLDATKDIDDLTSGNLTFIA